MSNTEVRLINANSFKRFLQALCKAGAPYEEVIQLLDKEPTACDMEKVEEQLDEYITKIVGRKSALYQTIMRIVRKGGVDNAS